MPLSAPDIEVLVECFAHSTRCVSTLRNLEYSDLVEGADGPCCQLDVLQDWIRDMDRFFGCHPNGFGWGILE